MLQKYYFKLSFKIVKGRAFLSLYDLEGDAIIDTPLSSKRNSVAPLKILMPPLIYALSVLKQGRVDDAEKETSIHVSKM